MVNVREIPVGSFLRVNLGKDGLMLIQVAEVLRDKIGGIVLNKVLVPDRLDYTVGKIHYFPLKQVEGIDIDVFNLLHLGFVTADKKGWQLMYYYGDMKLLYRYDKAHHRGSFRYMSEYVKTFIRLSCYQIHQLQNIMRYLTDDLEFEYQPNIKEDEE